MKLRKQALLDLFAPAGDRIHWWIPPAVPDFAGPADLAALLTSYRSRVAQLRQENGRDIDFLGDISDGSLGRLLAYAYHASFLTDEARPVLARFFVPHRTNTGDDSNGDDAKLSKALLPMFQAWEREWELQTHVHRFSRPQPLDDKKIIAKLAPTLVADDAVLLVREIDGQTMLAGIGLLNNNDWERQILRMPLEGNGRSGLLVEILGPGHIRVSEGMNQYILRANELMVRERTWSLAPVRDWLFHVSQALTARVLESGDWNQEDRQHCNIDINQQFDGWPQIDVSITWSRVLREALRLRHGGAFVVVPNIEGIPIKMRYQTAPFNLGDEIIRVWQALRRIWRHAPEDDILQLVDDKQCATHHLLSTSRSLAALSATDGCVVLDRSMTVHGFGGSIQIKNDQPRRQKLVHLQEPVEISPEQFLLGERQKFAEISPEQFLAALGERHKSAFELCQVLPDALVFVVSQDGDLRVFSSDNDNVQFADRLYP